MSSFLNPTPVKFESDTLKVLKESAGKNQRSLSAEIRFRIIQSIKKEEQNDGKDNW